MTGIFKKSLTIKKIAWSLCHGSSKTFGHVRCIYKNLGDIAVAKAIEALMHPYRLLDYDSGCQVERFEKFFKKRLFDGVLLGGGTTIFSSLDTPWFKILNELKGRKSFISFGTGVRDPDFFEDIDAGVIHSWIELLSLFDVISVRGRRSHEILLAHGLKNIHVIGDPVFYFSEEVIQPKLKEKKIGINISQSHQFYGNKKDVLIEIQKFLEILKREYWKITLYPTNYEDFSLAVMLSKKLRYEKINIFPHYEDSSGFLEHVHGQDIFVGVKLHSVILSLCSLTPSFMLAYQPKCNEVMQGAGLSDFLLSIKDFSASDLFGRVKNVYEDLLFNQQKVFEACQKVKNSLIFFRQNLFLRLA